MFDNYYGVLWQYQPPLFSNFIFGLSLSEKTNFYFPSPSFHFSEIIPLFSSLLFSISIKKNSSLCLSLSRKLNTQTLLEPQHFSLVISSVSHRTPESFVVVSHLREASSFPLSPMIVETVRLIASPIVAEKRRFSLSLASISFLRYCSNPIKTLIFFPSRPQFCFGWVLILRVSRIQCCYSLIFCVCIKDSMFYA
jgi:hypothetical protein